MRGFTKFFKPKTAQDLWNLLLAVFTFWLTFFTGLLVFITYEQNRPVVVAQSSGPQDFEIGKQPWVLITFQNIARTTADAMRNNVRLAILPFPLSTKGPSAIDVDSNPMDLIANQHIGRKAPLDHLLSSDEYAAVRDGSKSLIYIWGQVTYRDFLFIPHYYQFCFAFGGSKMSQEAGVCQVGPVDQNQISEEPNAQPVPVPASAPPSR